MTHRERNLWLIVGAVLIVCVLSWWLTQGSAAPAAPDKQTGFTLKEAHRLLKFEKNIRARDEQVQTRLNQLTRRFFSADHPEQAQIDLLNEVEKLAAASGLTIMNKHTLRFGENEIGVALEGKSSSQAVFSFIYQTAKVQSGLKIKRLQLHRHLDGKVLSYNIAVSSMLLNFDTASKK